MLPTGRFLALAAVAAFAAAPMAAEPEKDGPLVFKAPIQGDWADVRAGDPVRLIGTCTGLKDGAVGFAEAGRSHGCRPAVAAADISTAFATDEKAAEKKYTGRLFVVEGVCVAVTGGTLTVSGAKRAAVPPGPDPRLRDALAAKPVAELAAGDVLTGKTGLEPYSGKVVEITGRVHTLGLGSWKGAIVGLGQYDEKGQVVQALVQCRVLDPEPWRRLTYGQTVTIRGRCDTTGKFSDWSGCVIVKEGPSPVAKVTAEALAKAYAKDRKATDDTYREFQGTVVGKSLLVTGEVTGWDTSRRAPAVQLKGADGVTVSCYLSPGASGFPEFEVPAGAKVELVAQYGLFGTEDTVWLNSGLVRVLK